MRWRVLHVRIVMLGIEMKAREEDRAAGLARPGEDRMRWLVGSWTDGISKRRLAFL
ncbi:hypothetical protein M422DRAFT_31373 [Sphaerobolus stellatus SS14]|uniref:Uncharacterized protein n=1 Tax=Sphaerobolus stellatus (strain SS14) TaxID=990650 RepID=A0A0C9VV68_SPHS4|nr:hypothetical protein M422DRAFT_31373 [Sphaerobolus stellatus SS14]